MTTPKRTDDYQQRLMQARREMIDKRERIAKAEQAVIRAARRWRDEETDDDRVAAVKLCRALARLDKLTSPRPTRRTP